MARRGFVTAAILLALFAAPGGAQPQIELFNLLGRHVPMVHLRVPLGLGKRRAGPIMQA